jgi:hypothetical protein
MRLFTPSAVSRENHRANHTNDYEDEDKKRNSVFHESILLGSTGTDHKVSDPCENKLGSRSVR